MSDSDHSVKQKKRKISKYHRSSEPDFAYWTEEQKRRYTAAKTELERENIIDEVQRRYDEEANNKQILQHKMETHNYGAELSSNSQSSEEDLHSEEGEVRQKKRARRMDEEQTVHVSKKPESEEDVYEKTIKEATLKRNQIDYLLMKVYYNGVLEGAFVRIQELQFKKYVLAQVLAIVEGDKPYQLGETMTYKLLKLQIPEIKEPKYRHITLVSNQKVESQEYILWKKNCEELGIAIPSRESLTKKIKEIQRAFQVKLTDDEVESRIIGTVDTWLSQPKPQVYYNDLPVYQNFLSNQISIQRQTMERLDEFIQEITDSQEQDKVMQEDVDKLIEWKRQQAQCRNRIAVLNQQQEKIKSLYQRYQKQGNTNQRQQYQISLNPDNNPSLLFRRLHSPNWPEPKTSRTT